MSSNLPPGRESEDGMTPDERKRDTVLETLADECTDADDAIATLTFLRERQARIGKQSHDTDDGHALEDAYEGLYDLIRSPADVEAAKAFLRARQAASTDLEKAIVDQLLQDPRQSMAHLVAALGTCREALAPLLSWALDSRDGPNPYTVPQVKQALDAWKSVTGMDFRGDEYEVTQAAYRMGRERAKRQPGLSHRTLADQWYGEGPAREHFLKGCRGE